MRQKRWKAITTFVRCSECGEDHDTESVEFLNIEENLQGQDVMHFVCPVTNNNTKSLVFGYR